MKTYSAKECRDFLKSAEKLSETNKTIKDIFETSTETYKKEKACTYFKKNGKKRSYNYEKYKEKAIDYASRLSKILNGNKDGSPIGLKLMNSPNWPLMFFAILMNGHKPLPIDYRATKDATIGLLTNSKASCLISNDDFEIEGVKCVYVDDVILSSPDKDFVPTWEDKVIFCSSGTTGKAKMFVYDGESLCDQILASLDIYKESTSLMHPGKISILSMVPYHHVFGFMVVFLWYSFYGKNVVYPYSLNSKDLLYASKKGRCTHIFSVPLFWESIQRMVDRTLSKQKERKEVLIRMMMDFNLGDISKKSAKKAASPLLRKSFQKKVLGDKVEFAISGGGYLDYETAAFINSLGYPLYNGYGMTEFGITSVEQSPCLKDRLKLSIGKPFYGVSYKIKGDSDSGELYVKAPSLAKWRLIDGELKPLEVDKEGYFDSGDIAMCDKDGRYYLKGRKKDVIINSNGENIYPDELGSVFKNMKHVAQSVVLGIKERKNMERETVVLVLQLDNEIKKENLEEIKKEFVSLNSSISKKERIEKAFVSKKPLPMANGMKVKKFMIKKELESGDFSSYLCLNEEGGIGAYKDDCLSSCNESVASEIKEKIILIFMDVLILGRDEINENSRFDKDLGGDSMNYFSLIEEMNDEFSIDIPTDKYGELMTPKDFAKFVLEEKNGKNEG